MRVYTIIIKKYYQKILSKMLSKDNKCLFNCKSTAMNSTL